MIATPPEALTTACSNGLDTLLSYSRTAFEGVEKLVELNLNVVRATLQESAGSTRDLMSIKDPQELLAFQAAQLQPGTEKLVAYSRHLYDIAAQTQAELTRVTEAQLAAGTERFSALIDSATRNAPAGSETAVNMVKSALAAANSAYSSAYDSINKAARQAVEMAEANVTAATNAAVKSTAQAANAPRARKSA